MSRGAGFELRTRSIGITEEALVAQKVAVWEGIDVAKQSGTVSGTVSKLELLIAFPFRGCMELLLIGGGDRSSTMRGFSWIFSLTLMALFISRECPQVPCQEF